MSNIHNKDISLKEIVKNIGKDSYLIPKFQRNFVWKENDILDLGDSIIRGYPISSLLIMDENGSLNIGSHSLSKDDPPSDHQHRSDDTEGKFYILDGQQRLTAISRLFLNYGKDDEYYFDLLAILVEKYPDDEIKNDAGIRESCSQSKIEDIVCRSFPRSKKDRSERPTRKNNRFISGKTIINDKFGSVINKFLSVFKDADGDTIDKYTDYLNALLGAVGGYSTPATVIASDSELGIVIRVFEKVNSTGKKLTLFDLINAKSFQIKNESYKGGLSDYLTNKITDAISNDQSLEVGVNNFLKYNDSNRAFEKLDKIIRIFQITDLLKRQAVPSIFQSAMLEKEPEFWFEMWNTNGNKMLEIMSWMESERLIDIGQITFLEYAMAIFLANPKSFELTKFKTEIKKYALYLSLSGMGFNKSNLDIVEKIYSLSKQMTDSHESEQYTYDSLSGNLNLSGKDVLGITPSNAKFKAIMNIFYLEKIKGRFTVDITGNSIRALDKKDNHHIFPKSRVTNFNAKSKFNSIANFVVVDKDANRINIKDKTPKVYFSKIKEQQGKNKVEHFCKQNLIDFNEVVKLEMESEAEIFIRNRAANIANIINAFFD